MLQEWRVGFLDRGFRFDGLAGECSGRLFDTLPVCLILLVDFAWLFLCDDRIQDCVHKNEAVVGESWDCADRLENPGLFVQKRSSTLSHLVASCCRLTKSWSSIVDKKLSARAWMGEPCMELLDSQFMSAKLKSPPSMMVSWVLFRMCVLDKELRLLCRPEMLSALWLELPPLVLLSVHDL